MHPFGKQSCRSKKEIIFGEKNEEKVLVFSFIKFRFLI